MELKKGYKQTELGVIPEEWSVLPVSKLGETKRGASSLCIQYRSSGGVRFIRINDFFENNPVFVTPTDEIMRFAIHERDLLFAGTGASAGASYLPPTDWLGLPHSYNAPRIRVFKEHNKEFLLYSLQSDYVRKQQRAWFVGNAQPFLDTKAIANLLIAAPPTSDEQRVIAAALSDVDGLIGGLEQLIAKKRDLKQAVMQQLLTGKKRLAGFRGKWAVKKLEHAGHCLRGVSYQGDSDLSIQDTAHTKRLLRANNVQNAAVITDEVQFVNTERVSPNQILKKNDILICMANGSKALVGKAGIFSVSDGYEYTFGAFMGCFRTELKTASPSFIFHLFQTGQYRNYINNLLAGSSINNLRPSSIESLEFLFPEIPEQTAIAEVLSDMDAEISELEQRLNKTRALKQGMMQELLTGKTRLV